MYSWLETEILALSSGDYAGLYAVMLIISLILAWFSFIAFRRFRFIDATATSKIRSAAQGQVELKGLGEWMPQDSILSPFSQRRCVWYHCTIEKKKRRGKQTTWSKISDECSSHLFRLVDDTGECIIDPDDAHVIPEIDSTWYGSTTAQRNQPPGRSSPISIGFGKYRFRERLITPATPLYALGWFHTVYNNPSDEFVSQRVEDLVRQWKLQPERYLRDFDFDNNGKIQRREWQAIRAAARSRVLARIGEEKNEHHLLKKPPAPGQPFILSALGEKELLARKKLKAYAFVTLAFALFSALVTMFSIRAPLNF